jgi:inner membrane transporter RhtA
MRIVSAGIVFAVWRRPWRLLPQLDRETRRCVLELGLVLAVMNGCFYLAIERLPLGTVAAIEFLPVILLAALGVRSMRNGVALALAVAGVYVLTDVRLASEPLGIAFAFANAALFAIYIVLAHRVARSRVFSGIDGLASAMLVAAVAITLLGGWSAARAFVDPVAIGAGIGVGVASSVIPYVCDQLAMARLSRATYSLMVSLLPATATVVGIVVLAQVPSWLEVTGVALVVGAVGIHREAAVGSS